MVGHICLQRQWRLLKVAQVVGCAVARDREQPRRGIGFAPVIPSGGRLKCPQEDLLGQVFRAVCVTHPLMDVVEEPHSVSVYECLEVR